MDVRDFLRSGERMIMPDDPGLCYSGRLSRGANGGVGMVFPCSYVKWRFTGDTAAIVLGVERYYFDVYAGVMIDGRQYKLRLHDGGTERIELLKEGETGAGLDRVLFEGNISPCCETTSDNPSETIHEIMFFKRQDACNAFEILGIIAGEDAEILAPDPKPELKMEVYGDSVSAGEVSEAVDRIASPDPEGHEGIYSNSWFSYSWITARKLNAELHDIAQGGAALLDGTGWFAGPDYIGMESIYDKTRYYPDIRQASQWDFKEYTPDIAVCAIGQNDANPEDIMKNDYDGEKAVNWRRHYRQFIERLRGIYPDALIICTTTILNHDEAWDRAIGEVVKSLKDERIFHFLYSKNGKGTPGHIRIPEAEEMAEELSAFIKGKM